MADHIHKQIRTAAAAALAGLASTGARVYPNRLYALDAASLPALRVFLDDEAVEAQTIHNPHTQERALTLVVECCAQANSGLDDACDQMSKEVEVAMSSGLTVDGQTLDCVLTGSQYQDEPGATPVGVKRLEYRLTYYTLNNAPDALT